MSSVQGKKVLQARKPGRLSFRANFKRHKHIQVFKTPRRWMRPGLSVAVALGLMAAALPAIADAAPDPVCTGPADCRITFTYTGDIQEWIVPAGVVSATVTVSGAQGGTTPNGVPGGRGAVVTATVPVTGGQVYRIQVGGTPTGTHAVYGGAGGSVFNCGASDAPAAGGGGSAFGQLADGQLTDATVIAGGGGGGGGHGYGSHGGDGAPGGASEARGAAGETVPGSFISNEGGDGGWAGNDINFRGRGGQPGYGEYPGQIGFNGKPNQGGGGGNGGGDSCEAFLDSGGIAGFGGGGGGGYHGGGGGGGGGAGFSAAHAKTTGGGGGGGGGGSNFVSTAATGVSIVNGQTTGSGSVVIDYKVPVAQTITFTSTPPTSAALLDTYVVMAVSDSGLPVSFQTATDPGTNKPCFLVNGADGAEVTFTAPGPCTITATQPGDDYHFAASATQVVTVPLVAQTVAFDSPPPNHPYAGDTFFQRFAYNGNLPIMTATGSCTVIDPVYYQVRLTAPGDCVLTAYAPAGGNYAASPVVSYTFTVRGDDPPVTFTSTPPANPVVGGTYVPTATGGSPDVPILFHSETPDICDYDPGANEVKFTKKGTCVISTSQDRPSEYPFPTQTIKIGSNSPGLIGGSSGGTFGSS